MAEHDPLRLPRVNRCPCCLRRSLLEDQRNLHSEEDSPMRCSHSSELDGGPPRLANPVWLDIYDRVGQDQGLRRQMKENELLEIAAREQRLIDLAAPLLRWGKVEVSGKVDVDLSRSGPPTYAGRSLPGRLSATRRYEGRAPPQVPAAAGNKSCCAQSRAAHIAGLRTAPLPARSSPASQHSGDGGLPSKKIALDLQLADLAVQIVNHLLRICDRRRLATVCKQLARALHQLLFPVADHRRMNTKLRRQLRQGLSPDSDAIATRALNSALCCFLFTPTSHVL